MAITVNKNFYKIMDSKIRNGLLSSGEFLKTKIKENLNQSGGSSNPGESPRKQSGDLYRSIQIDQSNLNNKSIKVGSDKDYAPILEVGSIHISARPYLRPAFRKNKKEVLNAFVKGAKR